ncbi:MAG: hypothetical protein O2923_10445 [Verrucomicrobia bacterium]|nr:hypothetical protein [Verrucomicrobiota bacterium]MDA1086230.1 hypothetical protein [Verrucomicrobiota bacterium]
MTLSEILAAPAVITAVMLGWFLIQTLSRRQNSAEGDSCEAWRGHIGCGSCHGCDDDGS